MRTSNFPGRKNPVMRHAEDSLQIQVVAEFKLRCPNFEIIAIPNGLASTFKTDKKGNRYSPAAARMVKMGMRKGASDLFFPEPRGKFFGLWIEMKSAVGKMSPEQHEFFSKMRDRGYSAEMANSRESFWMIISEYFNVPLPSDIDRNINLKRPKFKYYKSANVTLELVRQGERIDLKNAVFEKSKT